MKLSKSVLAGSLATAGIVLGAIAPAITAQAAMSTGVTNNQTGDVTFDGGTDGKGVSVGSLGSTDKLAIAYDSATGKGDGQASAQSNANVKVQSGLLTLDAVPDFGFGNAAIGTTVALDSNQYDQTATDSQGKGILTVTDSRADQPGFTVDASISDFTNSDSSDSQPFVLTLKKTPLKNDKGANVSADGVAETNKISIAGSANAKGGANVTADGGTLSTDPAGATLIDLGAKTYDNGPINASFVPDNNNALLDLTTDSPKAASKDGVHSYNATITWTLKTKAVAQG